MYERTTIDRIVKTRCRIGTIASDFVELGCPAAIFLLLPEKK